MKKTMYVLLVLSILAISLVACSSDAPTATTATQTQVSTPASDLEATEPAAEAVGGDVEPLPGAGTIEPGSGGQPPGDPGGEPPQEATDACNGSSEGDACEFTRDKGTETGVCETVEGQLACSPQPSSGASGGAATSPDMDGFILESSAIADDGALPIEFTCDGDSATLPLTWSGAPAETVSFALIMHHTAGPHDVHWYWVLYNIPADVTSLARNSTGIGMLGTNGVNGNLAYAPPCSKGPGEKVYTYTLYALSALPEFTMPADRVSQDVLLEAIQDITLASTELHVTYARQ